MEKKVKSLEQQLQEQEYYTTETAAQVLGYSVQHVRRLCARKKLEHTRRGGIYLFTPAQLEAYFKTVTI